MTNSDSLNIRQSGHERLTRFVEIGQAIAGNVDTIPLSVEERVRIIKSISADSFMDILYAANGLLRGEKPNDGGILIRQEDVDFTPHMMVKSGLTEAPDMEPPTDGVDLMKSWFENAKAELNVDTLETFAIQAYSAIIFLHIFPDANGRTGRNVFYYLMEGRLPDKKTQERPFLIAKFCEVLNTDAIKHVLKEEGLTRFKYYSGNPEFLGDAYEGEAVQLRFAAIKRAGLLDRRIGQHKLEDVYAAYGDGSIRGITKDGEEFEIKGEPWNDEEKAEYEKNYDTIRKQWFNSLIVLVGRESVLISQLLKDILEIPNPYALRFPQFMKLAKAIREDNMEGAVEAVKSADYRKELDGTYRRFDENETETVEDYVVRMMDEHRRKVSTT